MKHLLEGLTTPEQIRHSLLEAEEGDSSIVVDTDSRLTIPLNTAHRNVAASVATICTLQPIQRKEVSVKLIDIAEAALGAVEKTLKRSGTADASMLQQLRKINKLLAAFDETYSTLAVAESETVEGVDPEELAFNDDEDGTPPAIDADGTSSISPVAIRVLANNSDMNNPDLAKGDPAKDDIEPPAGEATDATVDTEAAEDKIINTLADASDKDDVPPTFKVKGNNEDIHDKPSENLKLLSILVNAM